MADDMDRVQQHVEDCARDALAAHALRPQHEGRTSCANLDCGEAIAPVRTALGAQCYFWARLAYVPLYAAGVPYLRTVVWGVSLWGLLQLLWALL